MEIKLSGEALSNVRRASLKLGLSEEEVVSIALKLYVKNIEELRRLQEELVEWDALSDEALENFEKL
ncbi:MAG: hypothetical protein AABY16_04395 [Nanoarchaeota archaeon]